MPEQINGFQKETLRTQVRGVYDLQKLRIQMGNRIVANVKARDMGNKPSVPESEALDKEDKKYLDRLRADYKKIMDGLQEIPTPRKFVAIGLISDYAFLSLFDQYVQMEKMEERQFALLEKSLQEFPVWTHYLKEVRGIGPALAGIIISEIDITKAKYPSSLWKYAGLDTVNTEDGRNVGRSRKKESLVKKVYINKDGEEAERDSITFNPFLKTKLIGVAGSSFLRVGEKGVYAKIYNDYKNRLTHRPDCAGLSKLHIHNRSIRYMIKQFLVDLHREWRKLEGFPPSVPYSEGKLGYNHGTGTEG